jgi:hypothetical protein
MSKEPEGQSGLRIGQIILLVLILGLFILVGIKYFPSSTGGPITNIPKEIQLNYIPSDYNFDVDEGDALAILTNPKRYRREFNQLVYDLNMSILNHVATRMGLSAAVRAKLPKEYDKHHSYLRNLYYDDFLMIKDTTSTIYQTWYDNKFRGSTDVLYEVAAKYTCYLVNNVIGNLVPLRDGAFYGKGKKVDTPCGIAMTEALAPFMKKLEDRANIEDFGLARGLLQQRVEKVIAELATLEIRDKKGLTKQLKTKLLGVNVSTTDIEISAISIMKIGFRLDEYFDIKLNSAARLVTVTLPPPVILSHEVYPKLDKLDIGWLREIKESDLNRAFNSLREEFRREAVEGDAFDKAKEHAKEVLLTMMGPMISSLSGRYKLKVRFQEEGEKPEFAPKDQFKDLDRLKKR